MDFDNFFSNWDTAESYAALAITLIGFLFGLLIGYLLRSPRIRRLREELETSNQQLDQVRRELGGMKDQLDQKEADVQRVNYDLVEMTDKVNALEENRAKLSADLYHSNQEIERLQAENRLQLARIEELNNRLLNQDHHHSAENEPSEPQPADAADLSFVSDEYNVDYNETEMTADDTRRRMEQFEAKLSRLEEENQELRARINALHPTVVRQIDEPEEDLAFEIGEIEPIPDVGQAKPVLYGRIIVDGAEKDDLTCIKGIGPFWQKKLYEMGVHTYAEIAQWDSDRIEEVTRQIAFFPGRIEKDDWVGQAARLYQLKKNDPDALAKKGSHKEGLQVVEGIGPKIEELLCNAGINTLQDLAEASQERLHAILHAAGDRYRIHDPATWAQQARLAADGKWEELREWQDKLTGGRL